MKNSMDEDDTTNINSPNLVDAGANDKDKTGSSMVKSSTPLSTILASAASNTNHQAAPHASGVTKVCVELS